MWITKLKIAIIEKNPQALEALMDDIPNLTEKEDMQTAVLLLKEASEFMQTLKGETKTSMIKIQKNLQFLRSTEVNISKKLDIRL